MDADLQPSLRLGSTPSGHLLGLTRLFSPQEEFLQRNPKGINPVSSNDVFFSLHAVLLCLVYVCQVAIYKVGLEGLDMGEELLSWCCAPASPHQLNLK